MALPLAAKLLLAGNVGALLFALTMQYGFGVLPCYLCVWERIPYASVAVSVVAGFGLEALWTAYVLFCSVCALLAYLAGAGLSFFHTGVERHVVGWNSRMRGSAASGGFFRRNAPKLVEAEEPRCDVIPWSIFGLSLANLNVLGSLALAFFTALAAKRAKA